MYRVRFLFAVLWLAGTIACSSASAAQPSLRLAEIFVMRVVLDDQGEPALHRGMLHALDGFKPFEATPLPPDTPVPPSALGKYLIPAPIYFGYDVLGPYALANFVFDFNPIEIGVQAYFAVSVVDSPKHDTGFLVNISTRGVINADGEPLIGGFTIEERPRRVLIRGVGPTLAEFGVLTPLADPTISVFRHGELESFASNNDWGQQANVDEIEQTAELVGAFALPRASKDAVCLLELEPGLYTVHLSGSDASLSGTALVEIYSLP